MHSGPTVDTKLLRRIEEARIANEGVQAVFGLKSSEAALEGLRDTQQTVEQLLKKVADETGKVPSDYNVFKSLNTFIVEAPAEFVETMMEQEEIASAVANVQ